MGKESFIDPTPDSPVDTARFLSFLDLTPILATLETFYGEPWRHRHPPEAMLRLYALYKLKRLRFLTELHRLLDEETLRLLGFRWRPSYKTLWHWLNKRIKQGGLEAIHTALIRVLNQALEAQEISLGLRVAGDASPIQALPRDPEAKYNGYYKKVCYLIHRLVCCTTNLTLAWAVTPGNVDEAPLLAPLLLKARLLELRLKEAYFDNGYSSPWNYATMWLMGLKARIRFRKNAEPGWRGKPKTLRLRCRKMVRAGLFWNNLLETLGLDLNPGESSLEGVLLGLMLAGQHEYVGAYHRNLSLKDFREDEAGWLRRYGAMHNVVEGCHGHQKDWLDLDNLRARGLRKARVHASLVMLSEALVAYTRVQNGVTEGLTSLAGLT